MPFVCFVYNDLGKNKPFITKTVKFVIVQGCVLFVSLQVVELYYSNLRIQFGLHAAFPPL
jgi:hypothetical protein